MAVLVASKRILAALALALLLLFLATLSAPLIFKTGAAKNFLLRQLDPGIGLKGDLGSLAISLSRGLNARIKELRLSAQVSANLKLSINAQALHVKLNPVSLLVGRLQAQNLLFIKPEIKIEADISGAEKGLQPPEGGHGPESTARGSWFHVAPPLDGRTFKFEIREGAFFYLPAEKRGAQTQNPLLARLDATYTSETGGGHLELMASLPGSSSQNFSLRAAGFSFGDGPRWKIDFQTSGLNASLLASAIGSGLNPIAREWARFLSHASWAGATIQADFEEVSGSAMIGPEKIELRQLRASDRDLSLNADGTISPEGRLNLRADLALGRDLTQKAEAVDSGKFFKGKEGRFIVPFTIKGTLREPKISINFKRIFEEAARGEPSAQGAEKNYPGAEASAREKPESILEMFAKGGEKALRQLLHKKEAKPRLTISADKKSFGAGETLTLRLMVNKVPGKIEADGYLAIQMPDGNLYYADGKGSLRREVTPVAKGAPISDMALDLLSYSFAGDEPPGEYMAIAVLVRPGADPLDGNSWLSEPAITSFTFSPR